MRGLVVFLLKRMNLLLFLFLEFVAFFLLFNRQSYHRNQYLSSSSSVSGFVAQQKSDVKHYFTLQDENTQLKQENFELKNKLRNNFIKVSRNRILVEDSVYDRSCSYIPAQVIRNTTNHHNNYMTLNIGSVHGVKKEMGVIGPNGIVGFVADVTTHYSSVISVLNEQKFITAVYILPNHLSGLMKWNAKNSRHATISGITKDVIVEIGDKVVTKGSTARFPKDVRVGKVIETNEIKGSPYQEVIIELSTNFNSLYQVYVIENHLVEEFLIIDSLQNIAQ